MCPKIVVSAFVCMLLAAVHGSVSAAGHPWSGAYVSVVSGAAQLEAADERAGEELETGMPLAEGDRLAGGRGAFIEVAFRSGGRLWLDADTDAALQRIFDGPAVLLEQGALFVHVPAYAAGDFAVDIVDYASLDARIFVRPGGLACIQLGTDAPLVVDLWAGRASVEAAGSSLNMHPAQRLRLSGDREFRVVDFITEPGTRFEVQTFARLRKIEAAGRQESLESSLQGIEDLEDHGRWSYDDEFSTRVWRPYVASDWRPFYNGRWLHHPRGVYWLAHDPWGGVTYHYGSWRYSRRGYWCWVPGYVFSPAAVRFYSSGDYLVWVPAGMHTRFTYGTWWPDDYYRYAVMCRRGSLYKKWGRHCSGRHKGNRGCDDDGFERPRHGSRREVKEVDFRQLPAPPPGGTPEGPGHKKRRPERPVRERLETSVPKAAGNPEVPGQKNLGPERPLRESLETSSGLPERRTGRLHVMPSAERTSLPDAGVPPVKARSRRSGESALDQDPVFSPQPTMQRRSSGRPGAAESPPVFRTPHTGPGSLSGGSPSGRRPPSYSPQPAMQRRSSGRPGAAESPPVFRAPHTGSGSLSDGSSSGRPQQRPRSFNSGSDAGYSAGSQ